MAVRKVWDEYKSDYVYYNGQYGPFDSRREALDPIQTLRDEFINKVVQLAHQAGRLELWRTMHAFRDVMDAFGQDIDPEYAAARAKEKETA